ncbi:hypothetical protein K8640_25710 [Myxococcus sp. XM-1-1-1]|uniref:hypothetical protein n=1 Tax=Myxococcus sp. XM-1-1-1 TaxID=2874602 RepID=UPI001CBF1EA9|nr:hypothetical protein [Myxococcus sp. XM-1-1-1]MBZ4411618.1 hypothetical protein [Myxococcus sp. XM-1-1-1]BDT30359.1 hypothetical protein MFMH1_00280 [Myxococcus sp. MH1]
MAMKTVWFDFENTRDTPVELVMEPWGMPYTVQPGGRLDIACEGPEEGELQVKRQAEGHVTLFAWAGATYRVLEGGKEVDSNDLPVPGLPPGLSTKQFVETLFGSVEQRRAMRDEPED